jgi:hypothetical protein
MEGVNDKELVTLYLQAGWLDFKAGGGSIITKGARA